MTGNQTKPQAIVLLGHGSRDAQWRAPMDAVRDRLLALTPDSPVQCAFLELAKPDLGEAVAALAAAGVSRIRVVPLFLGVGRHVREDLPGLIQSLREAYPQLAIELRTSVGEDARLIELLARIASDGA